MNKTISKRTCKLPLTCKYESKINQHATVGVINTLKIIKDNILMYIYIEDLT